MFLLPVDREGLVTFWTRVRSKAVETQQGHLLYCNRLASLPDNPTATPTQRFHGMKKLKSYHTRYVYMYLVLLCFFCCGDLSSSGKFSESSLFMFGGQTIYTMCIHPPTLLTGAEHPRNTVLCQADKWVSWIEDASGALCQSLHD